MFGAPFIFACAAQPNLLVKMYNPKTKVVRNCSARESAMRDIPAIAAAVEACARQLESHGFVRLENGSERIDLPTENATASDSGKTR